MNEANLSKRKTEVFGGVDFIGLALDLEEREKTVESQTTKRAMSAAAHGLRLMGAEIERLTANANNFHMAYRMKCDEETKAQAVEIERLRSQVWRSGDANDTMRHPEESDICGGATDAQRALEEREIFQQR